MSDTYSAPRLIFPRLFWLTLSCVFEVKSLLKSPFMQVDFCFLLSAYLDWTNCRLFFRYQRATRWISVYLFYVNRSITSIKSSEYPEYLFLISERAGERRFASIVAKRLESLVRQLFQWNMVIMVNSMTSWRNGNNKQQAVGLIKTTIKCNKAKA